MKLKLRREGYLSSVINATKTRHGKFMSPIGDQYWQCLNISALQVDPPNFIIFA